MLTHQTTSTFIKIDEQGRVLAYTSALEKILMWQKLGLLKLVKPKNETYLCLLELCDELDDLPDLWAEFVKGLDVLNISCNPRQPTWLNPDILNKIKCFAPLEALPALEIMALLLNNGQKVCFDIHSGNIMLYKNKIIPTDIFYMEQPCA